MAPTNLFKSFKQNNFVFWLFVLSKMNYLAHIYLSGNEEKTMVGNFIGDYVKGKDYMNYPEPIRKGILLHREIDSFTDRHPNFREAKKMFRTDLGLYSGIVVDLVYDHLLARNWKDYSDESLRSFAKRAHAILLMHFFQLPKSVQGFLPFLIQNKRLESYATVEGIKKSLEIMSRHTSLPGHSPSSVAVLSKNISFFTENFDGFMADIIDFVRDEHNIKLKKPDVKIRL